MAHRRETEPCFLEIATDSQYTINHIESKVTQWRAGGVSRAQFGKATNADILEKLATAMMEYEQRLGRPVQLTKVPAHKAIPGNEIADVLAKWGTTKPLLTFTNNFEAVETSTSSGDFLAMEPISDVLDMDIAKVLWLAYPNLPVPSWFRIVDTEAKANHHVGSKQEFPELYVRPKGFFGLPTNEFGNLVRSHVVNSDTSSMFKEACGRASWCGVKVAIKSLPPPNEEPTCLVKGKVIADPMHELTREVNSAFRDDTQLVWTSHRHSGKVAPYLKDNGVSSRWHDGLLMSMKGFFFGHQARIAGLATCTNEQRWSKQRVAVKCRKGFEELETMNIFSKYQKGFLCNSLRIMEAAIMVKSALENARQMKKNCYLMPIDFANAFGAVPHEVILYAMRVHGIPKYIEDFVKSLYGTSKTTFKVDTKGTHPTFTDWIEVKRGVLQGDSLSPLLFNLVIDILLAYIEQDADHGYNFHLYTKECRKRATPKYDSSHGRGGRQHHSINAKVCLR
jgi:ribonuclease HI